MEDTRAPQTPPLPTKEEAIGAYKERTSELFQGKTKMTLLSALKLDLYRLQLGLTPAERDMVQLSLGLRLEFFDPNRFVYRRDMDMMEELAKSTKFRTSVCSAPNCSAMISSQGKQCASCFRRYCPREVCSEPMVIVEHLNSVKKTVCNRCAGTLADQVRLLNEVTRAARAQALTLSGTQRAHAKLLRAAHRVFSPNLTPYEDQGETTSLALYPKAGILASVPTAPESAPAEALLFGPSRSLDELVWSAPPGVRHVELMIVLSSTAMVHAIEVVADTAGYSPEAGDLMRISVQAGSSMADRKEVQVFDLAQLAGEGGSDAIAPGTRVRLELETPTAPVRMVTLSLALPETSAAESSVLHASRVVVLGAPMPSPVPLPAPLPYPPSLDPPSPPLIKQLFCKWRDGRRTVDIGVDPWQLKGIVLTVRHGESGPDSQVKAIRVTACGKDAKKKVISSYVRAGQFTVPLVAHETKLAFDFERPITKANVVSVRMLYSYGGGVVEPPKISLY